MNYDGGYNIAKVPFSTNEVAPIREIPDHATFREREDTLGWLDKLGFFLSLALCNLAIFDQLYLPWNRRYHSF